MILCNELFFWILYFEVKMSIIESLQKAIKEELDKFDVLQKHLEDYIEEDNKQESVDSNELNLATLDKHDDKA